jgi:hypothetical protein
MTATEELHEKSATLPEPLAREVLDFLLFVASRHKINLTKQQDATSLRGALKGCLSTSDDFAAQKADEKNLER